MAYKKKRNYSNSQKQAYHSGRGYAVGHKGRGINFRNKDLRASFEAGYKAGLQVMGSTPTKYPALKK